MSVSTFGCPSTIDKVDNAETGAQGSVLVKEIQHHVRVGIALEFDHDAHSGAVAFVAQFARCLRLSFRGACAAIFSISVALLT